MGTNYYLRPKGYDSLDSVNHSFVGRIYSIKEQYIKAINDMIEESNKVSPLYQELLNIPDVNNTQLYLQYEFELPELHICKLSGGWIPLLESTKYYKSWREFEEFYKNHSDVFTLCNEYNEIVDFDTLKKDLFDFRDRGKESHLTLDTYFSTIVKYWKDEDGLEWTDSIGWS